MLTINNFQRQRFSCLCLADKEFENVKKSIMQFTMIAVHPFN